MLPVRRAHHLVLGLPQQLLPDRDQLAARIAAFHAAAEGGERIAAFGRFDVVAGKRTELLGILQTRYGHDNEKGEREINDWLKKI